MRIAVVSDIHGNMDAFEKVIEDIERARPDSVFSLGDNIGYGAESEQVIRALRLRGIPSVLGNHELAALDPGFLDWFNPTARRSLVLTFDRLSADSLAFIQKLPTHISFQSLRFVHGFPPDSPTRYMFQIQAGEKLRILLEIPERICFVGHTHGLDIVSCSGHVLETVEFREGLNPLSPDLKYIINIGSVGQPRDGDTRAKYVIWDSLKHILDIRCLPYDTHAAAAKILAAGMPEQHARQLLS